MKKHKFISWVLMIAAISWESSHAQLNFTLVKGEGWVKYTCKGVVTPVNYSNNQYAVEKPIMVGHLKINPNLPYPSFEDLRDTHPDFFKNMTDLCTTRRRDKVQLGSFTGTWLDWGTDYGYSRLEIGEVFIPKADVGKCRSAGAPCSQNSNCCQTLRRALSCNQKINTCEFSDTPLLSE